MGDIKAEISGLINKNKNTIDAVLCEGFESLPLDDIRDRGLLLADSIIKGLAPFSKKSTFPDNFSARVINSRFALSFIIMSNIYWDFLYTVRTKSAPKNLDEYRIFTSPVDFLKYTLETFSEYLRRSYEVDSAATVVCSGIADSVVLDKRMNLKLILEIDLLNTTDHILNSARKIIDNEKSYGSEIYKNLVKTVVPSLDDKEIEERDPNNYGFVSKTDDRGRQKRSYETVWPIWFEAYQIMRLANAGYQEQEIINAMYSYKKGKSGYDSRKTTVNNRKNLAKNITTRAFMRLPLVEL